MKRRSFLAAAVVGSTTSVAGCLSGEVVEKVQKTVRVPAHRGWIHKIESLDGAGEVGYEIRSEENVFEVFYFADQSAFESYQEYTLGSGMDDENEDAVDGSGPQGDDSLSQIAVENPERGAYEAVAPRDGSRVSMNIDTTHYLVVDHSNYGMVGVKDTAEDLPVTVGLEVVKRRF